MANMHQFQADMLKIMCSQAAEVNNNEMQGIDGNYGVDCKSPREIPRTALGENIETRRSQGGEDGICEANHFDQVKEGEAEVAGMTPSRADVGDVYQTELVESVLFEETKTEGNLIEKRRAVIFEVTDESLLNKKLDVADDLSTDDTVSVLELDSKAVKSFEEKEDEVSRLLFALRALCTSDNTDVVLLCGTWQMRPLSKEDRKKIQDLHLRDYVGNFCPQLTEELEILWRVGRKAEIQQVSEEREPGFLAQGFLSTKLLYLETWPCLSGIWTSAGGSWALLTPPSCQLLKNIQLECLHSFILIYQYYFYSPELDSCDRYLLKTLGFIQIRAETRER